VNQSSICCQDVCAATGRVVPNSLAKITNSIYAGSNASSINGAWSHPLARFSTGSAEIIFAGAYPLCYGLLSEEAEVISARCHFPACVELELHHKG
jgi:hypothetical protein